MAIRVILIVVLVLNLHLLWAQQSVEIDSLNRLIRSASVDTIKITLLNELSMKWEYATQLDSAENCAKSALSLARQIHFSKGEGRALLNLGSIASYRNNIHEVNSAYEQALPILQTIGDTAGLANLYHRQATDYYLVIGDYTEAIRCDSLSIVLKESIGDQLGVGHSLINMGNIYNNLGDNGRALQTLQQALTIMESLDNRNGIARTCASLATVYQATGKPGDALNFFHRSLTICEEIGNNFGIASNRIGIANIESGQGDYPAALHDYQAALKIYEQSGYKGGAASINYNISRIYKFQGKYAEALENSFQALQVATEGGDKLLASQIELHIAGIYLEEAKYSEALDNALRSLKIAREIGNKNGIAYSYATISAIYDDMGNVAMALENQQSSLQINKEIGDKSGMLRDYRNMGMDYRKLGKDEEALTYYNAGLQLCRELGEKPTMAEIYEGMGRVYEHQGNIDTALSYLTDALNIRKDIDYMEGIPSLYAEIGDLYRKQANYPEARMHYREAIAHGRKVGSIREIHLVYKKLSEIDSLEGDFSQALADYKIYVLIRDSVEAAINSRQTEQLKIQYETEKKDREIDFLNKDNEIKTLQLGRQHASLYASKLEAEKSQNTLVLMNDSLKIQQLTLDKTQQDLNHQQLENRAKEAEMTLLDAREKIKEQQLAKQKIERNVIISGMVILMFVSLLFFRGMQLRKILEKQQAILRERQRISADLHDDIGSGLARISLLSELVKNEAKAPETQKEVNKIASISRELLESIREIIWALNSNNDHLENLVAYIRRYAAEYFENSPVSFSVNTPSNIPPVPVSGETRRNIFFSVKEALHNIIKHARSTEAELTMQILDKGFSVRIHDNGQGFDITDESHFGNGLRNMYARMQRIHGDCKVANQKGTTILLRIPLSE